MRSSASDARLRSFLSLTVGSYTDAQQGASPARDRFTAFKVWIDVDIGTNTTACSLLLKAFLECTRQPLCTSPPLMMDCVSALLPVRPPDACAAACPGRTDGPHTSIAESPRRRRPAAARQGSRRQRGR